MQPAVLLWRTVESKQLPHMSSDYAMKRARELGDAQQELAGVIRCFQEPKEDADKELCDIRENICFYTD